jgi:hypothetical protein
MKKFYVSFLCLLFTVLSYSQTNLYWIGASGSNYNNGNNWSLSAGGAPAGTVPGAGHRMIFNTTTQVNIDVTSITVNAIHVINNSNVTLYNTPGSAAIINVTSQNPASQALDIATGSSLTDSAVNANFTFNFPVGARGVVNGNWIFTGGDPDLPPGAGASMTTTQDAVGTNHSRVDVNGAMVIRDHGSAPTVNGSTSAVTLFFNNNSYYLLMRDANAVPKATWAASSTIYVGGSVNSLPTINTPTNPHSIGNLVLDAPALTTPFPNGVGWLLPDELTIQGDFRLLNTNNTLVYLATNTGDPSIPTTYTVNNNLEIGNGANIAFANPSTDKEYIMTVLGDFVQTGGVFSLRDDPASGPITITQPTTLELGGDFNQNAGTFTTRATVTSTALDLYVLELNGTGAQTITSSSNTINNATHQVTLRLNNAAGVTLLSPLETGKLSFNSANKGILTTTTANYLTIGNPSTTDALVVNAPSSTGHVSGPVRRRTNEIAAYLFPTGKGGVYHSAEVIPSTTTPSIYRSEYFNTGYSDLSVAPPLLGVSNQEYWFMNIDAGTPAAVQLSLNGTAIPGAGPTDKITVAKYNGADWVAVKGTSGTTLSPGNSTSGSVRSDVLASFAAQPLFTLGFAPANSLAVVLVHFNAKKENDNAAKVNWEVTKGSTPDRFEILRSTDNRNFYPIGSVSGNAQQQVYDFNDLQLPRQLTFYRLRIFDTDGSSTLSRVVAVSNGGKALLITSIMPTVVKSNATLNISSSESGTIQLVITDSYGRMVRKQMVSIANGNQQVPLDLQSLATGAYQITGYMNGERTESIRFIKQ